MLCENAMSEILTELVDDAFNTIHFIDAIDADRPRIKAEVFKTVKRKLKNKYNMEIDDDYLEAYIGDYVDDLATDVIEDKKVNEGTRRIKTHRRFIRENKLEDLVDSGIEKTGEVTMKVADSVYDLGDRLLSGYADVCEFIADKALAMFCKIFSSEKYKNSTTKNAELEASKQKLMNMMYNNLDKLIDSETTELVAELKQDAKRQ